tara:strand:+ start:209 stop:1216 length:1008 start_codon:yes stop_codon:yes gene_type:complete
MAFLDNSGDIILDAVLTDLGRKRLSEGNFRITQFALGDDEIDYSLYNKAHPSGSAYYDLEILQTPVFEAFTRTNANINYGLMSYNGNTKLLYLPIMLLNEKVSVSDNITSTSGVSYLAVNDSTNTNVTTAVGTAVGRAGSGTRKFIFETGLQTAGDPDRTIANRTSYIVNNGLLDRDFTLSCDSRFIGSVYPIDINSEFKYDDGSTSDEGIRISLVGTALTAGSSNFELDNYSSYNIGAIDNMVGKVTDSGKDDLNYSQFTGPRARVTAFTFAVVSGMESTGTASPANYSLYGKTAQNLFADGNTYDYIDTIVYIRGNTTGVTAQLPVRIIRQNT